MRQRRSFGRRCCGLQAASRSACRASDLELAERVVAALNADELFGRSARSARRISPRWATWRTGCSAARRPLRGRHRPSQQQLVLDWDGHRARNRRRQRLVLTVSTSRARSTWKRSRQASPLRAGRGSAAMPRASRRPPSGSVPSSRAAGSGRRARRGPPGSARLPLPAADARRERASAPRSVRREPARRRAERRAGEPARARP